MFSDLNVQNTACHRAYVHQQVSCYQAVIATPVQPPTSPRARLPYVTAVLYDRNMRTAERRESHDLSLSLRASGSQVTGSNSSHLAPGPLVRSFSSRRKRVYSDT